MCGIVGIVSEHNTSHQLYDALLMLQHRGQDAAGIVTAAADQLYRHKGKGLISEVFARSMQLDELKGTLGIGHVRYPTAGDEHALNAQPLDMNSPYGIALAHNGNIVNPDALRATHAATDSMHEHARSDSEALLSFFAGELAHAVANGYSKTEAVLQASNAVHAHAVGAFSIIMLVVGVGIVALRDKFGIRPLVLGKRGAEYIVASESVALDVLDFDYVRDVEAGETLIIDQSGTLTSRIRDDACLMPCLFEYVYLARPDSCINGVDVSQARMNMGMYLAKHIAKHWSHLAIDTVIPVPDTSRTAACELAHELGKPHREGFIKNRYIGRTFIAPASSGRGSLVKRKLNPIRREFVGKNVLLVDDSIVRGTTSERIISMVRACGAKKVYLCSAAPPVKYQNIYGIDMPTKEELLVNRHQNEQAMAHTMGVDALIYQTLDGLIASVRDCNPALRDFEDSIFTGRYITEGIDELYLQDLSHRRSQQQLQFGFAQ